MKSKIESNKKMVVFLSFIINIFFIIIMALLNVTQYDYWQSVFRFFTALQIVTSIFFIYKIEESFINFSVIFYMFSNLFHIGLLPYAFNDNTVYNTNLINIEKLISVDLYRRTLIFIYICHSFLIFGILLSGLIRVRNRRFYNNVYQIDIDVLREKNKELKIIGLILLVIGIFPKLYIDYNKFILFMNGSYIDTYNFNVSGYLVFISTLTRYGLMMLLLSFKDNRIKKVLILLVAVLTEILPLVSGNRATPIIFIIVITFLFIILDNNFKFKKAIFFSLLGYLAVITIVVIGDTRGNPQKNLSFVTDTVRKYISFEPINRVLQEFGGTIITVSYSLKYFPEYAGITLGYNYLIPILYIFPNFGYQEMVYNEIAYIKKLPEGVNMFLGGSYLGEAYYSFNILGPIVIFFIGVLVSLLSFKVSESIKRQRFDTLIFLFPILTGMLWYIRDFFGSMIREIVWYIVLILFIKSIVNKIALKKKYHNDI